MLAADFLRQRDLVVAADRADHRRAEMFRPLAQDLADAAGRCVHEYGVAFLDLVRAADKIPRRHALQHDRRRDPVVDAGGNLHQPVDRTQTLLGVRPHRLRIGDAIADLEFLHLRADRFDHARAFHAERERQRVRVQPAAVIDVDEVEADRGVAHQHLARAGGADLDLFPVHFLGAACFMNSNRV